MADAEPQGLNILAMTADIVAEYAATNSISGSDLAKLIQTTYDALSSLGKGSTSAETLPEYLPAVTVRKSLSNPEYIISLIDGREYKTLTRHLSRHGLTPVEYRQRYGLSAEYPMTAPAYSERRSALAKAIGLGRKPGQKAAAPKATRGKKRLAPTYK
jgi:predicted transcriptional regulator